MSEKIHSLKQIISESLSENGPRVQQALFLSHAKALNRAIGELKVMAAELGDPSFSKISKAYFANKLVTLHKFLKKEFSEMVELAQEPLELLSAQPVEPAPIQEGEQSFMSDTERLMKGGKTELLKMTVEDLMEGGMSEKEAYTQALEWIQIGTEELDLGGWGGSAEEEWMAGGTDEESLEESLYNDTQRNPTKLHDVDVQVTEIVDRIAATNRLIKHLTPRQKENVKSLLSRQGHV